MPADRKLHSKQSELRPRIGDGKYTGRGIPLLIDEHRAGNLDFADVTTFNLDEYVGLDSNHPQSYRRFMQEHSLITSMFLAIEPMCRAVSPRFSFRMSTIRSVYPEAGGIDLQLLGIGRMAISPSMNRVLRWPAELES